MNLKTRVILMMVLLGSSVGASAEGLNLFHPRKYSYQVALSRQAGYELAPGDYVSVDVISGPEAMQTEEKVLKKVQVIRILESNVNVVQVSLLMNDREIQEIRQALSKVQPHLALRIVQKQPRATLAESPGDGVPDLDLDDTTHLASRQTTQADPQ